MTTHNKQLTLSHAGNFSVVNEKSSNKTQYHIDDLSVGYNFSADHIIKLSQNKQVEWVVSRVCDHASGTLEPCSDEKIAQCPLHGWKLDLEKLHYSNVNVKKDTLNFTTTNQVISVDEYSTSLQLPSALLQQQSEQTLAIRFIAHACLLFTCGDINIITDPWLKGPCFLNGWWHKPAPSEDALDQLLNADLVYISHNHPDHMHEESLRYLYELRPDIPIIIPKFSSKSAQVPLENMGFRNIIALTFNQLFKLGQNEIFLSILKSGDFRDDSGLYISYGKKQALITVDSSALNHYHLPKNIDFLTTSFAGGASGHPWCFDHYDHEKKREITSKRHQSVRLSILKYLQVCQPKSYMPYAGYFSEDAPRDHYIKENNSKNSPQDIQELIAAQYPGVQLIQPLLTDRILINKNITASDSRIDRQASISSDEINHYLSQETIPDVDLFMHKLSEYFKHSEFKDDLLLYLIPCHDDFNHYASGIVVDFSNAGKVLCLNSTEVESHYQQASNSTTGSARNLLIKVRAKALWPVIDQLKSWEELSIGFHCRIHRHPDVYNSDFWYHFSNIYIH